MEQARDAAMKAEQRKTEEAFEQCAEDEEHCRCECAEGPKSTPHATAFEQEPPPRWLALAEAQGKITGTGERERTYGDPTENFTRIADALNALGYLGPVGKIHPHDVAVIMMVVKLSRIVNSPHHLDSYIDIAGYAACGVEVAREEA